MNKQALKSLLLKKQEELSHIGETIQNTNITKDNTSELNELSQVISTNNIISILDFKKHKALKNIQIALSRIEEDDFGCCSDCGINIDDKRLLANPVTTYCVDCQASAEKYEKTHHRKIA